VPRSSRRRRSAAGEAAGCPAQARIFAFDRAFAQHDWEALRHCVAADVAVRDHRALGFFEGVDCDRYVDSLRILTDLAPDVRSEPFRIVVWNDHGCVSAM
jgi:hypothetical protein